MAPKRKSDDMNVVAPVKNEKSTRSGGNDSIKSDHYQNILNNRQSIQEFTEKLFGDGICNMRAQPKQKTVTRVPRGKNADIQPPLGRKSERIATKTEDVRVFWQPRRCKYCERLRLENSVYSRLYGNQIFHRKENLTMHNLSAKCAKLTRSEVEWRRIGIDDNNEFAVTENHYTKIEGMEENDMIIRDVFAGDLSNGEVNIYDDEDLVDDNDTKLDAMNQADIFFQTFIRSLPLYAERSDNHIMEFLDVEEIKQIGSVGDLNRIARYLSFQRSIYAATYGINCLQSENFEIMVDTVKNQYSRKFKEKFLSNVKLYTHWTKHNFSRSARADELNLIRDMFPGEISSHIPKSVTGVRHQIEALINSVYKVQRFTVAWPEGWNMETYPTHIDPIVLYLRDPIELIAELFINPEIMFKNRNHVRFDYYEQPTTAPGGASSSPMIGDLMCSEWCKQTQLYIRENKNKDGNILPIIFYSDGVQLNDNIQNKVTPVMCTTGNFSESLLNSDLSKCIIGYLPSLRRESKLKLANHLSIVYRGRGGSVAFIEEQIKQFDLLIEREYWKEIVKGIKTNWDCGIELHVLGHNTKLFYPCVAFFVGDDPQQHRQAGIQEGNCTHSCIYCTYRNHDGVYNPAIHIPRDYDEIKVDCLESEKISLKKIRNPSMLTRNEKDFLKKMARNNIHPYVNPLFYAPMGINNNIFIATPPDTLHLFCAGLMKSLVKSIITVVNSISKLCKEYSRSPGVLDSRLSTIGYVHDMPHVYWATVHGGIMRHVGKSKQERSHSTGSFGGFRSTTFISLLIQIYYCIIPDNSILPSADIFIKHLRVKDVKGRVLRSIYSLLDVYFEVKRSEWEEVDLQNFEQKVNNLYVHYMLVWDLKHLLIREDEEKIPVNMQRNPHKLFHLVMCIKQYGSTGQYNSGPYESAHRYFTTGVYRATSKRQATLCLEMIKKYNLIKFAKTLGVISMIHYNSTKIIQDMKPAVITDNVYYEIVPKHKIVPFFLDYEDGSDSRLIVLNDGDKWKKVSVYQSIDTPNKLIKIMETNSFFDCVYHYYGIEWDTDIHNYRLAFVGGIKYKSNPKSIGEGILYATARFNIGDWEEHKTRKPRYDYVLVRVHVGEDDDNDDECSLSDGIDRSLKSKEENEYRTILVKLILFISLEHELLNECKIMCLAQELYPVREVGRNGQRVNKLTLGRRFKWAGNPHNQQEFKYHFLSVETILRPAMVIPVNTSYSDSKPTRNDVFYMLDRRFFDRSGWRVNVGSEEDFIGGNMEEQVEYLRQNYLNKDISVNHSSTNSIELEDDEYRDDVMGFEFEDENNEYDSENV